MIPVGYAITHRLFLRGSHALKVTARADSRIPAIASLGAYSCDEKMYGRRKSASRWNGNWEIVFVSATRRYVGEGASVQVVTLAYACVLLWLWVSG